MKITNDHGLPEPIYRAYVETWLSGARPDHGISVTELIAPPQQVRLLRERRADIKIDVLDIMRMVEGAIYDRFVEPFAPGGSIIKQRLWMRIADTDVSGEPDLVLTDGSIVDHKNTSRWAVVLDHGVVKPEYEAQVNLYALLRVANGFADPPRLQLWLRLYDWSETEAGRGGDYPQSPVIVQEVRRWTPEERMAYARERVRLHTLPESPECSPAERWETPTVYAVMKPGRKSAVKLHEDEEEAHAHRASLGQGHTVVTRPGVSKRCYRWCMARSVCPQFVVISKLKFEESPAIV